MRALVSAVRATGRMVFSDLWPWFPVSKMAAIVNFWPPFLALRAKEWQNKRHVFAPNRGVMAKSYKVKFTDSA